MNAETNLSNHFLIAMPGLQDSNFYRTVTYICEHNEQGAMGIVINRPLGFGLADVLEQMEIKPETPEIGRQPVFSGGPVQTERGFVLHPTGGSWDATTRVTPDISITTSRDILEAIAAEEGPKQSLIALGYAGWGEGQLEAELSANAWLSGPADSRIIFELPPEQRWQAAARLLGVDLNLMSGEAGHA
ncbi:MAG TPA: YqgE/AlgH family protein [Sedimenticola sp.]|nr:YqgE/AlgH family protein [Sedimenticola sp.]